MSDKIFYMITIAPIFVFWILMYIFIDIFSRKGVYIGVGIGEENSENIGVVSIRREYRRNLAIFGIITSVVALIISYYTYPKVISFFTTVPVIAVTIAVYLYYNKKLKDWKKENLSVRTENIQRVDIGLSRDKLKHGNIPWKLYLIPIAMIIGIAIFTIYIYGSLPDNIPVHWEFDGKVDRYEEKSIISAFSVVFISIFMLIIMMFMNYSIVKTKQKNNNRYAKVGVENILKARRIWSYFSVGMTIVTVGLFAAIQLMVTGYIQNQMPIFVITIALIVFSTIVPIIIWVKVGNMGENISKGSEKEYFNDEENWILGGSTYYNKKDPSFFVAKRVGIGFTVNFGNKKALVLFIAIILLSIGIPIILAYRQ